MEVPRVSENIWIDIVKGKTHIEFEFLAAKIFMGRVKLMLAKDSSFADILAKELHALFAKNSKSLTAQSDIKKLY